MRPRIAVIATVVVACLGVMAPTAAANPPERSATFTFHVANSDFFAGTGQQCAFPVVGSWDVTAQTVTYFDSAGNPVRVVGRFGFVGTFSNPANGKSIPDSSARPTKETDYYAPDGTILTVVIMEVRDDPYLHTAIHLVFDPNGDLVVADNGRDYLAEASHLIDIQPLCDALS
jgi:hypothetical protein